MKNLRDFVNFTSAALIVGQKKFVQRNQSAQNHWPFAVALSYKESSERLSGSS
ncbi:MAG: hypothetical protein ACLQIB_03970 [Isosphaeraceae bacterium]